MWHPKTLHKAQNCKGCSSQKLQGSLLLPDPLCAWVYCDMSYSTLSVTFWLLPCNPNCLIPHHPWIWVSLQEDGIHDVIKVQLSSYCPPVETMGLVFHYNSLVYAMERGQKGTLGWIGGYYMKGRRYITWIHHAIDYEILFMTFSTNNSSFPF